MSLGAGLVTWADDRRARAYVIRTGRRLSWEFSEWLGANVQHTRSTLYRTRSPGGGKALALYAFPLR